MLRTLDCRTATYESKAAAMTPNREGHCREGRQDGRQSHQPRDTETQGLVRWPDCALRSDW
jgi:inosine/xanthosine triphosphate pyrophosphatase family protein